MAKGGWDIALLQDGLRRGGVLARSLVARFEVVGHLEASSAFLLFSFWMREVFHVFERTTRIAPLRLLQGRIQPYYSEVKHLAAALRARKAS